MQYQFDTNAGFVAAVNEMLLQSHIPSHISFLPALPAELSDFGHAKRLNCRGGVTVSMLWEKGILRDVKLHLEQPHPWLNEVAEDKTHRNYPESPVSVSESQADARSNNNKSNLKSKFNTEWVNSVTKLSFDSPNELVLTSSSNSRPDVLPCAALGDSDLERRMLPPSRRFYRTLEIFMFPCTITLQAE